MREAGEGIPWGRAGCWNAQVPGNSSSPSALCAWVRTTCLGLRKQGAAGKGGGGQDVIRAQGCQNGCRVVLLLPRKEKMEQGMQNDRE